MWAFKLAVGQGPRVRGLPRPRLLLAVRDPAQQHRDPDGRRLPGPPGPGAHRLVRAGADRGPAERAHPRLDDHAVDAAVEPGAGRRAGHRLRGVGGGRAALPPGRGPARPLRAGARRRHAGRHREGRRAGRPALHPAVPVLRRPAQRLPGAGRRLRVDRGRHRRRPPVARASARTTRTLCDANGIDDGRADGRAGPLHGRGRAVGRHARVRRQPARHPGAQGRRPRGPPRDLRPPLPALLALRQAARLPGRVVAGSCR